MQEFISDLVEPIHAESFFSVGATGEIHERLCYEYLDPEGYYKRVIRDQQMLANETEKLAANMQHFLDLERVEINGKRVRSKVIYCDIYLKGHSDVVAIVYLIDFTGRFVGGMNKIETWLEEETAPYDFEIIWRFPIGTKIAKIDTQLEYEIYDDLVSLWAGEGEDVGGYEKMVFILPEKSTKEEE